MEITFLGTNGWFDTHTGATSCVFLNTKDSYIILTKADKVKNKDYKKNLDKVLEAFEVNKDHVFVTSSEKRKGISNILDFMEKNINLE